MRVGTLGNVVFEVSDTRVFTPSQVTRERKARIEEHQVQGAARVVSGPEQQHALHRLDPTGGAGRPAHEIGGYHVRRRGLVGETPTRLATCAG